MVLDIETLLAPLPGEDPAGADMRLDTSGGGAYYRLKDARSAARIAERQADAESERGALAPEWRFIFEHAQSVLASQSKDLEIACWLTEAALRIHGFAGLRDATALLAGLVDRYWPGLHSVDGDDLAAKVAPLANLNGVGADGSLIQPMRLAPLTAPNGGEPAGLWHYTVLRRRGAATAEAKALAAASKATDSLAFIAIYRDISAALASYDLMTAQLDTLCGEDAPPSSTIRNTLVEAQDALRDFAGIDPALLNDPDGSPPFVAATPIAEPTQQAAAFVETPPAQAVLSNRDDALRELSRIATYFREHEPNSPTGYTLQTLIRRARLPLPDLLQELIPDETVRRLYLNGAGIGPEVSEK
jgi:type VI secretion system protein ImpA